MPRVTVILTDVQYAKFKEKAGDVPLSRWLRTLASNEVFWNPLPTPEQQANTDKLLPKIGSAVTIKTPPKFVPSDLAFTKEGRDVLSTFKEPQLKVTIGGVEVQFCEHGASAFNCKKWGCKFYEIPNGRR